MEQLIYWGLGVCLASFSVLLAGLIRPVWKGQRYGRWQVVGASALIFTVGFLMLAIGAALADKDSSEEPGLLVMLWIIATFILSWALPITALVKAVRDYRLSRLRTPKQPIAEAPAQTAPVEVAPVEAAPVEAAPVEAAPVEEKPIPSFEVAESKRERKKRRKKAVAARKKHDEHLQEAGAVARAQEWERKILEQARKSRGRSNRNKMSSDFSGASWDDDDWDSVDPVFVQFDYRDASGNETSRHVDVRQVRWERFRGYCHQAEAIRTFRVDRIQGDVLNLETGEVFDPEEWLEELV